MIASGEVIEIEEVDLLLILGLIEKMLVRQEFVSGRVRRGMRGMVILV
jgi:hypothetical protein